MIRCSKPLEGRVVVYKSCHSKSKVASLAHVSAVSLRLLSGLMLIIFCLALDVLPSYSNKLYKALHFDGFVLATESAHTFALPSHNIACKAQNANLINKEESELFCERFEPKYLGVRLRVSGLPEKVYLRSSDTGGPYMEDPVLVYGTYWTNKDFGCSSDKRGLTCKNIVGTGFSLSRDEYSQFDRK